MKVVHIASADLWGGAEAQVATLARALAADARVEVNAILMNPDSRLGAELRAAKVPTLELDERVTSTVGLFRKVRRHLSRVRPDIVHTHRQKEDIIGGFAAASVGVPSIRTVHGAPEPEMSLGARRKVLTTLDRWVARKLQSRAVAVSPDLANKLKLLLPGTPIAVVPNGVSFAAMQYDAAAEVPLLPRSSPSSIRVGFFGRLVQVKRIDLLVQVAHELACMDSRPFDFYIVGEGPLQASLIEQARGIRFPERVHFLGYQPNSAGLMRQMDAVTLVSDHEGLPMVLLEAAALGVPILARAVGGIPEFMKSVARGRLLESSDPRDMAAQFLEADLAGGSSPVRRVEESFLATYSIEATSERYLALYREVIAGYRA